MIILGVQEKDTTPEQKLDVIKYWILFRSLHLRSTEQ